MIIIARFIPPPPKWLSAEEVLSEPFKDGDAYLAAIWKQDSWSFLKIQLAVTEEEVEVLVFDALGYYGETHPYPGWSWANAAYYAKLN